MNYLLVLIGLALFSIPSLGQSSGWWTCKTTTKCVEMNLEKAVVIKQITNAPGDILTIKIFFSPQQTAITCPWHRLFKGRLCFHWQEKEDFEQ